MDTHLKKTKKQLFKLNWKWTFSYEQNSLWKLAETENKTSEQTYTIENGSQSDSLCEDINYLSRKKPTGFLIYARYLMISAALLVPCHIFFGSEQA